MAVPSTPWPAAVVKRKESPREPGDGRLVAGLWDDGLAGSRSGVAHFGPLVARIGPMANVELERVEALELLGMVLAHLNDAEARREMSARVPMLMGIRNKLAASLREEQ